MTPKKYPIAERFYSLQGEGVYTGRPAAFLRLVGCSVGKGVCTHCDTDFDRILHDLGGGMYSELDLLYYCRDYHHVVLTGGEPLDRDLTSLLHGLIAEGHFVQIETSGTRHPDWLEAFPEVWITVSPKPGYLPEMIARANELKVIHNGLGESTNGWPTIEDANRWALTKVVFLQPRNFTSHVNFEAMKFAQSVVQKNPGLRLSVQLHKFLSVR